MITINPPNRRKMNINDLFADACSDIKISCSLASCSFVVLPPFKDEMPRKPFVLVSLVYDNANKEFSNRLIESFPENFTIENKVIGGENKQVFGLRINNETDRLMIKKLVRDVSSSVFLKFLPITFPKQYAAVAVRVFIKDILNTNLYFTWLPASYPCDAIAVTVPDGRREESSWLLDVFPTIDDRIRDQLVSDSFRNEKISKDILDHSCVDGV